MERRLGARTVIVGQAAHLGYSGGQMAVERRDGTVAYVPLVDIHAVMIVSLQTQLTACLINELHKRQISLIFCDEKSRPFGELVGYYDYHAASLRLQEQIHWKKETRKAVWCCVVTQKISMQCALLRQLKMEYDQEKMDRYLEETNAGDKTNREGQAARLYFNALFGKGFQRRRESPVNTALNYGYAILCSAITRSLSLHGFHPGLGIAHRGATNPFNLSYDIIEPFRPFVDRIVWNNQGEEWDRKYKNTLVGMMHEEMRYGHKRTRLLTAVEGFVVDLTKSLKTAEIKLGEIEF